MMRKQLITFLLINRWRLYYSYMPFTHEKIQDDSIHESTQTIRVYLLSLKLDLNINHLTQNQDDAYTCLIALFLHR